MDSKQVVKQTAKVVQNYLTYQAVRTVIDQLTETNPPLAIWFRQYSSGYNFQEAETYLQELMQENKELALRIMTVREDLAERVLEFLPPMVSANIGQDNMEHRRQLLERITYSPFYATDIADASHPELDINDSTN
ncbi:MULTISPECIES: RuBisCO chaperone RbcX [Planktothricoides]|jgi:RbcX protein|uniref:RuBisCO chaperone RbcX n=2 Tax=Planktothricoides raciborskii TaxID=132608 RepID=A0AAU8JIB1_9CYAN|nr:MULTISPECIES: chaperonin family protein RbcX [Planktothricoides]KOR37225.1 RbcX chaperonin protein [Planktothricoides sp. SR001]MBD2545719.1 chaperonin family protein RbcX [Planktothricoides raciborskii FACHB-1370]MBD2582709.1 chaperonin family protein RbcX [Planktothricoides raciborskii FACHB-1261]